MSDIENEEPTISLSGGSKYDRKRSKRRRSPSSSSSSSSSSSNSSSSTSSSESGKQKKSHKRKKRGGKRNRHRQRDRRRLNRLTQVVHELRDRTNLNHLNCEEFVDPNVSGELFNEGSVLESSPKLTASPTEPNFVFQIETKLKEPSVPKTPQSYLTTLNDIQRFGSSEWSEIRYAETQKSYNHSPGFVELEVNDEIKAYDSLRHLAHSDKAFAALTFCVLKQRETLQTTLTSILQWARDSELTYEGLSEKINEHFLNGEFYKISSELLQLVCGHRAEVVQMRRDGIANFLRDPLTKVAIKKIPPSCHHLFEADSLATLLEKSGGVRKAFLPLNKQGTNGPASQAGPSKPAYHPSQGQVKRSIPSQGISHGCCASARISHHQPSQGCYQPRPSQGQRHDNYAEGRPSYSNNHRGSFRPRGGRQGNKPQEINKGSQKRLGHSTESNFRGNKRSRGGNY